MGTAKSREVALFTTATIVGVGVGYILVYYNYSDCSSALLLEKLKDKSTWDDLVFSVTFDKALAACGFSDSFVGHKYYRSISEVLQ